MNLKHLSSHELNFELLARSILPRVTITSRRIQLQIALEEDIEISKDPCTWEIHFQEIKLSLAELNRELERQLSDQQIEFLETKIAHISTRLNTVNTGNDEQKIIAIENFKIQLKLAETTLTTNENNVFFKQKIPVEISKTKFIPIYKWNFTKFTGHNDSRDILAFLEIINELKIARGATDKDLFQNAQDLFEGEATIFCRNAKKKVINWDEFLNLLIVEYLPFDYQSRLEKKIQNITQSTFNNIFNYINEIEMLGHKIERKISEKEIIEIILRGVDPYFSNILVSSEYHTLTELRNKCKQIHELKLRQDNLKPTIKRNFTTPYRPMAKLKISTNPEVNVPKNTLQNGTIPKNNLPLPNKILNCWNCHKPNHSYTNCIERKNIFCYGCGKADTFKPQCSHCTNIENVPKNLLRGTDQVNLATPTFLTDQKFIATKQNKITSSRENENRFQK